MSIVPTVTRIYGAFVDNESFGDDVLILLTIKQKRFQGKAQFFEMGETATTDHRL
jgi:hypothetical protein